MTKEETELPLSFLCFEVTVYASSRRFTAREATPKGVLRLMEMQGITIYHITSHLQKIRLLKYSSVDDKHEKGATTDSAKDATSCNRQINEAMRMQMEMQERLHKQVEIQQQLQLRIEAQSKYLHKIIEEHQRMENLLTASACNGTGDEEKGETLGPIEGDLKQDTSFAEGDTGFAKMEADVDAGSSMQHSWEQESSIDTDSVNVAVHVHAGSCMQPSREQESSIGEKSYRDPTKGYASAGTESVATGWRVSLPTERWNDALELASQYERQKQMHGYLNKINVYCRLKKLQKDMHERGPQV